jgi:hypothetical protein
MFGLIELRLLKATKTMQTQSANMLHAYKSSSGLSLGFWLSTLSDDLGMAPSDWSSSNTFLFVHENGRTWTSRFFRETFLIPSLHEQRENGDQYLRLFMERRVIATGFIPCTIGAAVAAATLLIRALLHARPLLTKSTNTADGVRAENPTT